MDDFKIREVAINLELLMRSRFFQMFNPNEKKIKNWNVYKLVYIIITVVAQLVVLYGAIGFFVEMDDTLSNVELLMVIAVQSEYYTLLMKMVIVFYNKNLIWKLFDVTRLNFLTSELCYKNIKLLIKNRATSIKLTDIYFFLTIGVMGQWTLYPPLKNVFMPPGNNQRLQNIFNFRYPVTVQNYNQHYAMFWAMEFLVAMFFGYSLLVFDVLLISFCLVFKGQLEVLTQAFKEIGLENELSKEENYKYFKSVLKDQQQIYIKLKSFHSIWKPIVLIFIAFSSSLNISGSFALILNVLSSEETSILTMLKLGSSTFYVYIQIYMYCYLFETINLKRESVNFGIYFCNWMYMDLKFQKLILMTMQMNNANQLMIRASPKKIVKLQLFASIMMTSYNVLSVLIKTTNKKNSNSE